MGKDCVYEYFKLTPSVGPARDLFSAPSESVFPGREWMTVPQPKNPLHGVTLEAIVTRLVQQYGWAELGKRIPIKCFTDNPSIKSSLTFLRKTPWARKKVEDLYLKSLAK